MHYELIIKVFKIAYKEIEWWKDYNNITFHETMGSDRVHFCLQFCNDVDIITFFVYLTKSSYNSLSHVENCFSTV